MRNFIKIVASFIIFSLIVSCGGYKKVDTRKTPIKGTERAKQNVKEGRGVGLGSMMGIGKGSTNYEFSTSNPMWRATLDILDFLPLSTVDYSGGVIISDWYTDNTNKNQALKITVRFLDNQIRSNSLKVIVHKKNCVTVNNCKIDLLNNSAIANELQVSIIKKAARFQKEDKNKKK